METNSLVRIKAEFSEGDDSVYVVVEDRGDRCVIQPIEWPYGDVVGQETVSTNMLSLVRTN